MDDPPAAPDSPAPPPPSHSRDNSHDGDSQFSEHNPLQDNNPKARYPAEPKKPKAVALHGWQRTVGVDEDFDPTIPVCLGAPGTGLFTAMAGQNNPAAGVGVGAVAVVDLGNAKVTREDKKEAKSLRLQPAAPDAAPLPYPRVAAVDTASEPSSSEDTDDDDPTGRKKKRKDRLSQLETTSEASSDMSFLVNATSGSFLGNRNRQTFGRNIDPRIPATVGEERIYNSLAQYYGKTRRNIAAGGGGGGGGSARDAESAGGESRLSDLSGTAGGGGGKDLLLRQGSGAGSSSTPLASKTAGATPGSTTNSTALSASGGSGSGSTMNTNNSQTASVLVDHHHPKKNGSRILSMSIRSRSSGEAIGGGEEGESKRRQGSSRSLGSGAAVTEAMVEEGRLAKQASGETVPVEPGRRLPRCSFFRRWPWKILSGVVTLAVVVAVVVVVLVSTDGGSSSDTKRRLLAPQLLSPDGKGWSGGVGGGGAVQGGLGHSRRILSVDGVVEPVAVAGDGGDAAAGIAAAGAAAGGGGGGGGAAAAAAAAAAASAGAFSHRPAGEPPERERVVETMPVDGRDTDTPIRGARAKPVR